MYQYFSNMYRAQTQFEPHIGINNLAKVVGSEQLNFEPIKSPCNIVTPLQTPPSFCASATKSLVMNFQAQQYDQHQIDFPAWCFEFPMTTESYSSMLFCQQASGDNFTNTTNAESFMSNSADSHSSSEKNSNFPSNVEKYSNFQLDNIPSYEHFPQNCDKLVRDDAATDERGLEISFQRNQLDFCTKPEKQSSQTCGLTCVTSSNTASRRALTGKRRIRWTKDLHEPFMMIVNHLGGPEKAKPKAILEMMKTDLLSISHIKSHLQKCRSTMYMHKALQERSEEGHRTDGVSELQVKIHMQIEESRKLRLEVRRSIHQQQEMHRNLQMLIQQQRKQLKIMLLDNQKERTKLLEKILDTELDVTVPE